MKILITSHHNFHNKGCEALIHTTIEILKNTFPEASFIVCSLDPEYDKTNFNNDSIECNFIKYGFQTNEFSRRNRFWFFLNYYLGVKTDRILWTSPVLYEAIKSCDLMVVSGGDILADYGEAGIKHAFFPIAVALALKKPVYVFAQSFSRYNNDNLLKFARFYLDKVSLITVRERLSLKYLEEIKIKSPLHLTADPAFILKPCSDERLFEILQKEKLSNIKGPIIGVSVSETLTKWAGSDHENFLRLIADVCDGLIVKYNAKVVFISHVTEANPANDDRLVGEAVKTLMSNQKDAVVIKNEYSSSELKAIIGKCHLFIGARTHATIASSSQGVPTIALAYSTKAFGIMEDILDKERCVCDVQSLSREGLMQKAEYFLENGAEASKLITERLRVIKEQALLNGPLAKEIKLKGVRLNESVSGE